MKTVGDLLKHARIKRDLSLDQIAAYTRIPKKYLIAIEDNDFQQLPPAAFSKGFLRTYATIVGLNPQTILAIFRRDFDQDDHGRIIPRSLIDPVKPAAVDLNPNRISLILIISGSLFIIGFFLIQILNFSSKPPLTLFEPTDKAILSSPIIVRGQTSPQAAVTVNNRSVFVSPTGDFSTQLDLTPGEHAIIVVATSRSNQKTIQQRLVYIQTLSQ